MLQNRRRITITASEKLANAAPQQLPGKNPQWYQRASTNGRDPQIKIRRPYCSRQLLRHQAQLAFFRQIAFSPTELFCALQHTRDFAEVVSDDCPPCLDPDFRPVFP